MKRCFALAVLMAGLLCLRAFATDQLLDIVTLARSETADVRDKKAPGSVKIVVVSGEKAMYTLKCNEGEVGCKTPEIDTSFDLVANKFGVYQCEEVALAIRQATGYRGFYCLIATQPK